MVSPLSARIGTAVLVLAFVACGEDEEHFDVVGCRITGAEPITADESPLGFSARQVIEAGALSGGIDLRFGTERYPGPTRELEIGIESADLSRVQWVRAAHKIAGDFHPPCPEALTFPASIAFRTADGALDETLSVDVYALSASTFVWFLALPLDDVAGTYEQEWPMPGTSVIALENEPSRLFFYGRFDAETTGNWGAIWLETEFPEKRGTSLGPLADWGEEPDQPFWPVQATHGSELSMPNG